MMYTACQTKNTLSSLILMSILTAFCSIACAENWPGWRKDGNAISKEKNLPLSWSSEQNIRWTAPLPGEGNSSPVIWEGKIFVTAAESKGKKRVVMCLDASDGSVIWKKPFDPAEETRTYPKSGYASPTPATDGKYVFAFFDSPGLIALDVDGNLLWKKNLGPFDSPYNVASSPLLYKETVIQLCDHNDQSFIAAFDKKTGNQIWRTDRPTRMHYSSPLLIEINGKHQVVCSADVIRSYDADTGEEIWSCRGMEACVNPSPVFHDGLVYAGSGRNGPTMAIDPTGKGDVTDTHVRIHIPTGGPYVPSVLVYPYLMIPNDNGTMRFVNPQGNVVIEHRVRDYFTSSPVGADDHVYWASERGNVYVIDVSKVDTQTPSIDIVAKNHLSDKFLATPAISNGRIYLRSRDALYCIEGQARAASADQDRLPEGDLEELIKLYRAHSEPEGPDKLVRLDVVEAVSRLGSKQAIEFLHDAAVKDPHWDVCENAARLMVKFGPQAQDPSIALLDDGRPFMRVIAAENLGQMRSAQGVKKLTLKTKDGNLLVRSAAYRALGRIAKSENADAETMVDALVQGVYDKEPMVRQAAVEALGTAASDAGDKKDMILRVLSDTLSDESPLVAEEAQKALKKNFSIPPEAIMYQQHLYGEPRTGTESAWLTAGPLRVKFQDGELRYIHAGDFEVARRIYFGVRDNKWDTGINKIHDLKIDRQSDSFQIHFASRSLSTVADYSWEGQITGSSDGRISYTVKGQANQDFQSPRIGINVLLGHEAVNGLTYKALDDQGQAVVTGRFPEDIPSPLLVDVYAARTLKYSTQNGMEVEATFPNGYFGMEDQGTYGDTSYKIFNGIQYEYPNVKAGQEGEQELVLTVKNVKPHKQADKAIRVRINGPAERGKVPKLAGKEASKPKADFGTINRNRNEYKNAKSLTWSFNPALHLFDEDTYMENLAAVVAQVYTVREFAPNAKIRIDPISINPPYPRTTADPRNKGLFAAAWIASFVKYLSIAQVDEAVITLGPGPVDIVREDIAQYAGWNLLDVSVKSIKPEPVEVWGIENANIKVLWLINKTADKRSVEIENPERLDSKKLTAERLQPGQEDFRTERLSAASASIGIELEPYEVCKLIGE